MRAELALAAAGLLLTAGCIGATDPLASQSQTADAKTPEDTEVANWTKAKTVPTERTEVATTVRGDELIVAGGLSSNGPSRMVQAYNITKEKWHTLPALPTPLHHATAVTLHGKIHVFGGFNSFPVFQPTPTHYVLKPEERTWQVEEPLPRARGGHGAAVVDGKVYLVGGIGADQTLLKKVDVYAPEKGKWTKAKPLPTPRDHLAVASLHGKIHAVGGRKKSMAKNKAVHEALKPGEGWTDAAALPTARGGVGAAVVDGQILVAGGEGPNGTFENVEAYDAETGNWTQLPPLPTPRHGLGVASHEGKLWTAGGGPEPGWTVSGAVEVLVMNGDEPDRETQPKDNATRPVAPSGPVPLARG